MKRGIHMNKQVPFIGRELELGRIDNLVEQWDTYQIVCIDGPGGVGKTRLLQEAYDRHSHRKDIFVTQLVDFDDQSLHLQENLAFVISQRIGMQHFKTYIQKLRDYRAMEQAEVSSQRLSQEQDKLLQAWYDDFNQFTKQKRVVYLFDTVDSVKEVEILNYLITKLGSRKMQNTLCLIAGRNARYFWDKLSPTLGDNVHLLNLSPLSQRDSAEYLKKKQENLLVALEPDLAKKMLLLANGRPILIDLA
ncbi:AAA family ATPase, partial [Candidatus Peregrinibacteria bacterium]|nr:AAA family ATPase [Candidatus Peregrinibacteria bacterium]